MYDTSYLKTLVRYIEFNPIKAYITQKVGEYRWAMSSYGFESSMLDYGLIEQTNFEKNFDEQELQKIEEFYSKKLELKEDDLVVSKQLKALERYFTPQTLREDALYLAIKDGYKSVEIAKYLDISNALVSKSIKQYKQKIALFEKLKSKGVFWSYSKDMGYDSAKSALLIEYTLKYADFDDMRVCLELFGKRQVKKV